MNKQASEIRFADLDQLVQKLAEIEEKLDTLAEATSELNKEKAGLKIKCSEYLRSLERDEYTNPLGKILIKTRESVVMPKSPELKAQLWAWMRERGIYDQYATVQANSLKALFMAERDEAIARGEDPMTWALPGMEPAKSFDDLDFKPLRK